MKTRMFALLSCLFLLACNTALAWDEDMGGCNPYESNCQCTDPVCSRPWDSNCISRAECCEAFGNIGAR